MALETWLGSLRSASRRPRRYAQMGISRIFQNFDALSAAGLVLNGQGRGLIDDDAGGRMRSNAESPVHRPGMRAFTINILTMCYWPPITVLTVSGQCLIEQGSLAENIIDIAGLDDASPQCRCDTTPRSSGESPSR